MKFLRLAFYVLIAQLVLSGCAGEAVEETSSSSASEINFDAYVGRNASTRSGVNNIDFLRQDSSIWNAGFGVFARYNHTDGTTITSLMDTERVTWNKDQNHWEYTNTRFWPSEGFVDFYAFAPYNGNVTMGKLPDWVNKPDSIDETYIWFPSNMNPVDLLWANAFKQTKANNSGDKKVDFTFNHATARFGFDITAPELLENSAVITVDNVQLYCESNNNHIGVFDMVGYLNLKTGGWQVVNDEKTRWYYSWTPYGRDGENPGGYKEGEGPELKITGEKLSNPNDKITNSPNSFIFIIPQEIPHPDKNDPYKKAKEDFYLEITYTVRQGDFAEKVTVRKNLLKVLNPSGTSFTFVRGKAYVFHLILSLDPVNFSITNEVVKWGPGDDKTIPL